MQTFNFFSEFLKYIDIYEKTLIISIIMIMICPVTWNLIARWEFHTKFFTKIVGDNRLAADIFAHILIEMGIFRNYIYTKAIEYQPAYPIDEEYKYLVSVLGYAIVLFGLIFVYLAYYRLGIHGIYYADYFGILFKEKVTAFPYNITDNPLYIGSTSLFLGLAILNYSPSGLLLTVLVWFMYKLASAMENPMTDLIYSDENIKAIQKLKREREELNKIN
jgi:phosphatidylethanolamine N-methyltransferase